MIVQPKRQGQQMTQIIWIVAALVLIGTLLFLLSGQFEAVVKWARGLK